MNVSPFYPVDVHALPERWEVLALREVVVEMRPGFASGRHNRIGAGVPHLRPMNVSPIGQLDLTDLKFVDGPNSLRVQRGDVLFNNTNSPEWVGKTAFMRAAGEFAFSNHMTRVRVGLRLDPQFLALQLHFLTLAGYFRQTCTNHVNQASVSLRDLGLLPVVLPPVEVQRRIVLAAEEQLVRLDTGVTSLSAASRRTSRLRQEALDALVGGRMDTASLRKGWSLNLLGQLVSGIEAGKSFKCAERPARSDEWGVIKVSAMTWGKFDERENKTVITPDQINPHSEIRPGDLLLSRANTVEYVGAAVYVERCRPHLLLSDKSMRLRPVSNVDARWLRLALGCKYVRHQIMKGATGTSDSMRNISQAKVRQLRIPTPPKEQQREIADEWSRVSSGIDSVAQMLKTTVVRSKQLRRAILAAAFTGRLSVGSEIGQAGPMTEPHAPASMAE
jgi:type I restriction enzyme, S subunit